MTIVTIGAFALLPVLSTLNYAIFVEGFVNAAGDGDTVKVRRLLDWGADANAKEDNGGTALVAAVAGDNPAMVKLLISRGADVNKTETDGDDKEISPLQAAQGHPEIVKTLKDAGAHE